MSRPLYTLLLYLLLPLALLKLAWRAPRQPEYLQHVAERFGFYAGKRPTQPVLWLHAVSVGETRAAAPLIAALQQRYPQYRILITHATPTGRAAGEQLFGESVDRCYLPYDLPGAMKRFLAYFQPRIGLLMETELWFNLIAQCARRDLPLLLVNARLSEKSARGYARLGRVTRDGLRQLSAIAAQTEADATRLKGLGALQVEVSGNLKFDVALPEDLAQREAAMRALFGASRPVLLAASTREGEEALLLDAYRQAAVPGMLLVIVPRHPQRFDAVAALLEKRGIAYVRRSAGVSAEGVDVVLGDSMGEMFSYYTACDAAFIGGSLLPFGSQNLIEACAVGRPVLIGPHTYNFQQAAAAAIEAGAAQRVNDVASLADALRQLFADRSRRAAMGEAGVRFCAENRGSTQRVLALVERALVGRSLS